MVRAPNEDQFLRRDDLGLWAVADGMGGYACGEIASELVKSAIEQAIANGQSLEASIRRADQLVRDAALKDPNKAGMGSTVIAVKLQQLDYQIAWVGDSRAYLWDPYHHQGPALKQITRDHSYVETLIESGAINYQQALSHPNRNLITQAVGIDNESALAIDTIGGRLVPGQQLLLCSDGLVDEVSDGRIATILNQSNNSDEALKSLLHAALTAGGRDNITALLVSATITTADNLPAGLEPNIIRTTWPGGEPVAGDETIPLGKAGQINNVTTEAGTAASALSSSNPRKAATRPGDRLLVWSLVGLLVLAVGLILAGSLR